MLRSGQRGSSATRPCAAADGAARSGRAAEHHGDAEHEGEVVPVGVVVDLVDVHVVVEQRDQERDRTDQALPQAKPNPAAPGSWPSAMVFAPAAQVAKTRTAATIRAACVARRLSMTYIHMDTFARGSLLFADRTSSRTARSGGFASASWGRGSKTTAAGTVGRPRPESSMIVHPPPPPEEPLPCPHHGQQPYVGQRVRRCDRGACRTRLIRARGARSVPAQCPYLRAERVEDDEVAVTGIGVAELANLVDPRPEASSASSHVSMVEPLHPNPP
jgi:hypothetical protein